MLFHGIVKGFFKFHLAGKFNFRIFRDFERNTLFSYGLRDKHVNCRTKGKPEVLKKLIPLFFRLESILIVTFTLGIIIPPAIIYHANKFMCKKCAIYLNYLKTCPFLRLPSPNKDSPTENEIDAHANGYTNRAQIEP